MTYGTSTQSRRGAARHWLIGCGAVLFVIVVMLVIGGYFAKQWFNKNVAFSTFDVQTKVDPPLTATPDEVLPPMAAGFTRDSIEVTPFGGDGRTVAADGTTTGILHAVYTRGTDMVKITAVPTAQAQEARAESGPAGEMLRGQNKPQIGQGVHMRLNISPEPIDMAAWSNRNWTYMIQTTATQALPFAEQFEPTGAPAPAPAVPVGAAAGETEAL